MEYYFFDVKIQDRNTYLWISIYIVFLKLKTLKNLGNIMLNSLRARILAVIFAGAILIAIDGSTISPILESIRKSFGVNESLIT